jgi:hypothetical protein
MHVIDPFTKLFGSGNGMLVASGAELRAALNTGTDPVIELAPGEYRGPFVIRRAVTLRGQDRLTVLWCKRGAVLRISTPGVTLERLTLERTVDPRGATIVHDANCVPTCIQINWQSNQTSTPEMALMEPNALISLGELIPGSPVMLPLQLEVSARTEIISTGLHGANITPSVLREAGSHRVMLVLDGRAVQRGELLLGELTLNEGGTTRLLWITGTVLDSVPPFIGALCLGTRKTRLHPSQSGITLDHTAINLLEAGRVPDGQYGFLQRDASGLLYLYLAATPPAPITLNNTPLAVRTRTLLREKDTLKIGEVSLTVQPSEETPVIAEPDKVQFADFQALIPDPVELVLRTGKTGWRGEVISALPWLSVTPNESFRIPPNRSHSWRLVLNEDVLTLPDGIHEMAGGVLIVGQGQVFGIDVRLNVNRPDIAIQVESVDVGALEWRAPIPEDRTVEVRVANAGRSAWSGDVVSRVPWLEVVTPLPITVEAWSAASFVVRPVAAWDDIQEGVHEISDALVVMTPESDQKELPISVIIEITPAHGRLRAETPDVYFDAVERHDPNLPHATVTLVNEGAGAWIGRVRIVGGWVQVPTAEISIAPGESFDLPVELLDIPQAQPLDQRLRLDEIQLIAEAEPELIIPVDIRIVELPPYLAVRPLNFAPFVVSDAPPDGTLTITNIGPARWHGQIISDVPWLVAPDRYFTCDAGMALDVIITLNGRISEMLPVGLTRHDHALRITGGREPLSAPVQVDMRPDVAELHLETPTLNFGRTARSVEGDPPTEVLRLLNASPTVWTGRVEIRTPWLAVEGGGRAFEVDISKQSTLELRVMLLPNALRTLPAGVTIEESAITISGKDHELAVSAMVWLDAPNVQLEIEPRDLRIVDDVPQTVTIRNVGVNTAEIDISPVRWLRAEPLQLTLPPEGQGTFTLARVKDSIDLSGEISDLRAVIVIVGAYEVEIAVTAIIPEPTLLPPPQEKPDITPTEATSPESQVSTPENAAETSAVQMPLMPDAAVSSSAESTTESTTEPAEDSSTATKPQESARTSDSPTEESKNP